MADLLDHAAERSASKAVTAIKWNILHDAKHPVDGSPQSFIEFFMRICTLCKLDPVLSSAFLESEGTVIASGVTMYANSTRDALIDEASRNQKTPTKHVAGRIVFLPSLVSEHRNAIPAAAELPAHRTPVAPTGCSSPMSSAPSYTTTDLNADTSGRDFDEADTAPLAGDESASRPPATPALPTSSPYRIVAWILQRIQQDLGLALHALILDQSLGDKLYEKANGNGIAMLVLIEAHIRNNMHGSQAVLTSNFARLQLLGKTFPISSPNSAHTFKEWLRDFREIANLVPHATESADLHTTLTEFVARFPDKHRSDIAQQMKIYKSNRKSRTGDCDLSSDDEEASCSAKQLLDYLCHDIHSALRVKDKAAREVTTAEALRLSSASLEKKAAPSEMDKLIKQIASLKAQLQAPPASAPAGTPVRALAVAPEQPAPPRHAAKPRPNPKLANYRDFVLTPTMRNCSNCNERHLDRDCPNRPPPEPLRAPATAAGAGTADPPKVRAPRPAAVAPRATAPDLPATAAAQPPPAPVPAVDKPAPALTTRRFAPARTPAPALSALR